MTISSKQEIDCIVNAPHDCITHSCEIDGTAGTISEEREATGFSKPAVVHNHPNSNDTFILNTHMSHCRSRLAHLYPPIPAAPTYNRIATIAVENTVSASAVPDDSSDNETEQQANPAVSSLLP
jgi:hypothetical protein